MTRKVRVRGLHRIEADAFGTRGEFVPSRSQQWNRAIQSINACVAPRMVALKFAQLLASIASMPAATTNTTLRRFAIQQDYAPF